MAYEGTVVPVSRSQELIRKMIYAHNGTGINFLSQRPREGFEALMTIKEQPYFVRIMAECRTVRNEVTDQEEKRVWRVLYWHLKAMFEAADSGVIDIRDVIMPYVVTADGRTLSEHLVPKMQEIMGMVDPSRLLAANATA